MYRINAQLNIRKAVLPVKQHLKLVVIAAILTLLLCVCGGGSNQLTYRAGGSATGATVAYSAGDGSLQEVTVNLPWETTIEIGSENFDFQFSVANTGSSGEITCEVLLNEESMMDAAASGTQIACSGDVNKSGNSLSYHISSQPVEAFLSEAQDLYDAEDYAGALAEVEKALAVAPNFSGAYFMQGMLQRALGDSDQALSSYSRAIELAPEYIEAFNNRGLVYEDLEDWEAAIADWTTAITLDPKTVQSYYNRARAYFTLGDYMSAEADVLQVQALSSDPEMLTWAEGALDQLAGMAKEETSATPEAAQTPELVEAGGPSVGQYIFFTLVTDAQRVIYALNLDNGDREAITPEGGYNWDAALSPDGARIAFVSAQDGNPEIYAMDVDGSNLTRLTNDPAADYAPVWSPDSSMIAFVTDRNGNADIYAISADGSKSVQVTLDPAHDYYPTWNQDGTEIAFVSERDGDAEIFVFNTNGSLRQVTQNDYYDADPAWSPNGRLIAFSSAPDGTQADIYVINPDGSELQQVTSGPANDIQPNWSADSSYILFASDRDTDTMEIYMMAESGDTVRLTHNDIDDRFPAWGPVIAP